MIDEKEIAKDTAVLVAKIMCSSAITAPKAKGKNNIQVKILDNKEELYRLADEMEKLAPKYGRFFARDAENVRSSDVVVLIGCKIIDFNIKQPEEIKYDINSVLSLVNLGIAIGSAVHIASINNVDNRIMYTIGLAAQKLYMKDSDIVFGIPLSIKGKNIYFDRK